MESGIEAKKVCSFRPPELCGLRPALTLEGWQELPVPEMFKLYAMKPWPESCIGDAFQVYGWSVRAAQNRIEFLPKDSKHYRDLMSGS